ncbi:phosphatase PAP2 family protein [Kordiimonas pumila]|uniref:Phosphatase PAP2 family protein n=1 Tax=Kordiimonas pumila TaxID=2161677 RepID=A0ABV7D1N6_9PROT|nr:phosphatase PAP2 family protein [Kordiimonas pumila]
MLLNKKTLLVIILLLALILWSFLTFSGYLSSFDTDILVAMRGEVTVGHESAVPIGPAILPAIMIFITNIGGSLTLIPLALLSVAWLYWRGEKRSAKAVLAVYVGVFILAPLLKVIFGRDRPNIIEHLAHASSASFPSGHALRSAVVYFVIAMILSAKYKGKNVYFTIACLLVGLIGFSRVYLGVHWPTDVIAGWGIAALWLVLMYSFVQKTLNH